MVDNRQAQRLQMDRIRFCEDIHNPNLWKKTKMKKAEFWVQLPDLQTILVNEYKVLEVPMNCRVEDGYVITIKTDPKHANAYTREMTYPLEPFAISGTQGEQWKISEQQLTEQYRLVNNKPITRELLNSLTVNGKIEWFPIENIVDELVYWAFHVQIAKYGRNIALNAILNGEMKSVVLNDSRTQHGYGDFIVLKQLPDGQSVFEVINGVVFPRLYSMKHFINLTQPETFISTPKPKNKVIGQYDIAFRRRAETLTRLDEGLKKLYEQYLGRGYDIRYEGPNSETSDGFGTITFYCVTPAKYGIMFNMQVYTETPGIAARINILERFQNGRTESGQKQGQIRVDSFIKLIKARIDQNGVVRS